MKYAIVFFLLFFPVLLYSQYPFPFGYHYEKQVFHCAICNKDIYENVKVDNERRYYDDMGMSYGDGMKVFIPDSLQKDHLDIHYDTVVCRYCKDRFVKIFETILNAEYNKVFEHCRSLMADTRKKNDENAKKSAEEEKQRKIKDLEQQIEDLKHPEKKEKDATFFMGPGGSTILHLDNSIKIHLDTINLVPIDTTKLLIWH